MNVEDADAFALAREPLDEERAEVSRATRDQVHAVRACAQRNIGFLLYSSFAYAKKERSSLSDFKQRCGFQRMDVPRYYVPLTRWGAIDYRLGPHHGLKDRLPESIAGQLRDARTAWLRRKYGAVASMH